MPRVELIQRRRPRAQIGKGDSLNMAYEHVLATLDRPADKVVFGVVDADGRLDPNFVEVADRHFADPQVGGLQLAVSIMNRRANLLTRLQDFEFLGFAPILLRAREHLGSVALGGNGQFARLSALAISGRRRGPTRSPRTSTSASGCCSAARGSASPRRRGSTSRASPTSPGWSGSGPGGCRDTSRPGR